MQFPWVWEYTYLFIPLMSTVNKAFTFCIHTGQNHEKNNKNHNSKLCSPILLICIQHRCIAAAKCLSRNTCYTIYDSTALVDLRDRLHAWRACMCTLHLILAKWLVMATMIESNHCLTLKFMWGLSTCFPRTQVQFPSVVSFMYTWVSSYENNCFGINAHTFIFYVWVNITGGNRDFFRSYVKLLLVLFYSVYERFQQTRSFHYQTYGKLLYNPVLLVVRTDSNV